MKKVNKFVMLVAALFGGLLLYSTEVNAQDDEFMPKAGFSEFISECMPVYPEPIFPSYFLTEEEVQLILQIGVLEAGETDVAGIANVMQVILNRVYSPEFPDSVYEVIFQKKQFSSVKKLGTANITPQAYEALDAVIFGEYQWNDSLFFESCDGVIWANIYHYTFSYGGHDFYKMGEA